jgi:hypothetical protein
MLECRPQREIEARQKRRVKRLRKLGVAGSPLREDHRY